MVEVELKTRLRSISGFETTSALIIGWRPDFKAGEGTGVSHDGLKPSPLALTNEKTNYLISKQLKDWYRVATAARMLENVKFVGRLDNSVKRSRLPSGPQATLPLAPQ
jgi:hypothetical protein